MSVYDETSINLIEFFKKLLLWWKLALILALCGGLIASGYKYMKDINEASNVIEKTDEELAAEIENGLSITDKDAVHLVADRIIRTDSLSNYAENAAKMQLDPLKCRKMDLIYNIQGDNPKGVCRIKAMIEQYVYSDEFAEVVACALELDADENYVNELIRCENMETSIQIGDSETYYFDQEGMLDISVLLPNGADGNILLEEIKNALKEYESTITGIESGCSINVISEKVSNYTDRVAYGEKTSYRTTILNEKNSIKSTIASFSDLQKKYLIVFLDGQKFNPDKIELYTGEKVEGEEYDNSSIDQINVLMMFFAMGVLVVVFVFVVVMLGINILIPKSGPVMGYGALNKIPILGRIRANCTKGTCLERALYKIDGEEDEQVGVIVSAIRFRIDDEKEGNITLVSMGNSHYEAEEIKKKWKNETDGDAKIIDLIIGKNKIGEMFEKLELINSKVVLVIKNDCILINDLSRVYNLMTEKKIGVIGRIEVL